MMISLKALLAVAVLAGVAQAQDPSFDAIYHPLAGENVPAGKNYTITWSQGTTDVTGPVTIRLVGGASSSLLNEIDVIGHTVNEALQYDWLVARSLGSAAVYGINITLDADDSHFQYSNAFHIVEGTESSSASSAASTASTASTAPSSTAETSSVVISSAPSTISSSVSSSATTESSAAGSTTVTTSVITSSISVTNSSVITSRATPSVTASSTPTTVASGAGGRQAPLSYTALVAAGCGVAFYLV